jgi:hypothetical protein
MGLQACAITSVSISLSPRNRNLLDARLSFRMEDAIREIPSTHPAMSLIPSHSLQAIPPDLVFARPGDQKRGLHFEEPSRYSRT